MNDDTTLSPQTDPNKTHDLLDRIRSQLGEFDVLALLRLLKHHGILEKQVFFKGYSSLSSFDHLIHSIDFKKHPQGLRVVITLNIGLLSAQSPLPEYFRYFIEHKAVDGAAMEKFIECFDHFLMVNRLCQTYPQVCTLWYPSWKNTQRQYWKVQSFYSSSTLQALFSTVYPEAHIQVSRKTFKPQPKLPRLGHMHLEAARREIHGRAEADIPRNGFLIKIIESENALFETKAWLRSIKKRFYEQMALFLKNTSLYLKVLVFQTVQTEPLRLSSYGHLNHNPMALPRCIVLHQGYVTGTEVWNEAVQEKNETQWIDSHYQEEQDPCLMNVS